MAKNRWYNKDEDAYIMRRLQELRLLQVPYGQRLILYQKIAHEVGRRLKIKRSWQGIQQRIRRMVPSNE